MFNFNVMNRALNDSNLSDKAFRMLYVITNYCSLKNSNTVEIHNAHFMMVLDISERWVRKITNELFEKGYITKTIQGTSKNKLANLYTLIEVEVNDTPTDSLLSDTNIGENNTSTQVCTQTGTQKFPLKNNNKIIIKESLANMYTNIGEDDNLVNTPVKEDRNDTSTLIDMDGVNEVIEVRNNEMNDDNKAIEKDNDNFNFEVIKTTNQLAKVEDNNNNIPTLEDVLRQQAEEQNNLLKEAYNDNFNFEGDFEIPDNSSNHFNSEEQKRYSNIFAKTKALIDEWYTTHDTITKAQIETNIKVIGWMYERGDISVKQFNTAQEKLTNHFKKLLNGHLDYVINKKYSSTFKNKNPQPPRPEENENKAVLNHENDSDIKPIIKDNKTQQNANKEAKMAIIKKECDARSKQFSLDTMEMLVNTLNSFVETKEEREEWVNRYFEGMQHRFPSYLEIMKKRAINKI